MGSRKSGAKSEQLRSEANRLYVQKKFHDALLKYNESLCTAEAESENLGLAFANRSAVYFEMKLYDKCLENVQLARQNRYPEKNAEILKKREERCLELMKLTTRDESRSSDPWSFFKLSHPSNPKLPTIADCLELRADKKYGRHIVTSRSLKVGDVIAIDEPAFKVIKADSRYSTCFESNTFQRCENCLRDNLLSLIPCSSCCKTMYCSVDCLNSAKRYHQFECAIVDELLTSGIMHIVVRMFVEGFSLFDGDIQAMERFINQREESMTVFDTEWKGLNDKAIQRSRFLAAIRLASTVCKTNLDGYENLFAKSERLQSLWSSNKDFIRVLLSKLIVIGTLYVHGIGGWSLKRDNQDIPQNPSACQQLIGNGCYLFCSLLNHSCSPNVKRLNVDDKVVVIVSQSIAKGAQLFDSYRPNFNNQSKAQRQEGLLSDYGFVCDCDACENNWPMNSELEVYNEDVLEFAWTEHEDLPFVTPDKAKRKLKAYFSTIAKHKRFPSAEIIVLQECISNCLIAITKPPFQFP